MWEIQDIWNNLNENNFRDDEYINPITSQEIIVRQKNIVRHFFETRTLKIFGNSTSLDYETMTTLKTESISDVKFNIVQNIIRKNNQQNFGELLNASSPEFLRSLYTNILTNPNLQVSDITDLPNFLAYCSKPCVFLPDQPAIKLVNFVWDLSIAFTTVLM